MNIVEMLRACNDNISNEAADVIEALLAVCKTARPKIAAAAMWESTFPGKPPTLKGLLAAMDAAISKAEVA